MILILSTNERKLYMHRKGEIFAENTFSLRNISCGRGGEPAYLIRMFTTKNQKSHMDQKKTHYMIFIFSSIKKPKSHVDQKTKLA